MVRDPFRNAFQGSPVVHTEGDREHSAFIAAVHVSSSLAGYFDADDVEEPAGEPWRRLIVIGTLLHVRNIRFSTVQTHSLLDMRAR